MDYRAHCNIGFPCVSRGDCSVPVCRNDRLCILHYLIVHSSLASNSSGFSWIEPIGDGTLPLGRFAIDAAVYL